jgi:hypothetical protein
MAESDKNEKAMAGLLRITLARASEASGPGGCPAPDILAAYYERSLNATESAQAEQHFANCARCQEELAAMVRAEPPGKKDEQATWNWHAMWRVLTPLAAAAAVVAIWVALRPSLNGPREVSKSMNEVAQTTNPRTLNDAPAGPVNGRTAVSEQLPSSAAPSVKKLETMIADLDVKKKKGEKKAGRDGLLGETLGALDARAPATPAAGSGGAITTNRIAANAKQGNEALLESQSPAAKTPAKGEVTSPGADAAMTSPSPAVTPTPAPAAALALPPTSSPSSSSGAGGGVSRGALAGSVAKESANEAVSTQLDSNFRGRSLQRVLPNAQPIDFLSSQFKVASPDPNVIWRVGAAGTIELTKNGGKTWQGQFLNMKLLLVAGMAPSEKVCWLVGNDGAVLRTTDGFTWKKLAAPAAVNLVGVTAQDALRASVTASDGRTFSTEDGGKTWKAN